VKQVHAVDAAGVHPLLLAIGSERYVPYRPTDRPAELLTQANAILGQGQLSLAKYLWILDGGSEPNLDIHHIAEFFQAMLRRVDWQRDLHFQTCTTIDTLDYSGDGFNTGSKLVIAAAGPSRRELPKDVPAIGQLPAGFHSPQVAQPGILAISGPAYPTRTPGARSPDEAVEGLARAFRDNPAVKGFPLIVIVDDSEFVAATLNNFLWVTFTRSNPAVDISGVDSFTENKHWGCRGSLIIDARLKPHHAPPLEVPPEVLAKVDAMAARGGALARWL
jgi:4-hydroxy-3-polyprenylbenzoate decarboxylase